MGRLEGVFEENMLAPYACTFVGKGRKKQHSAE
jgi:hypothetical protein